MVGVPDPKWGEVGKAFVVLKPGQSPEAEELLAYLGDQLARCKFLATLHFAGVADFSSGQGAPAGTARSGKSGVVYERPIRYPRLTVPIWHGNSQSLAPLVLALKP